MKLGLWPMVFQNSPWPACFSPIPPLRSHRRRVSGEYQVGRVFQNFPLQKTQFLLHEISENLFVSFAIWGSAFSV